MRRGSSITPILIYDRLDANRRASRRLLIIFMLVSAPAILYAAHYATGIVAMLVMVPFLNMESFTEVALAPIIGVSAAVAILLMAAAAQLFHRYSADLVLRMTNAHVIAREEEPILQRIVENLCIGSGLPKPRLAIIESTAANIYSTGLEPDESTLVLTRGLLKLLDRRELEGVIAQELSQIGGGDVRLGTIMATVLTLMLLPYIILARAYKVVSRANRGCGFGCLGSILYFAGMTVVGTLSVMGNLEEVVPDPTTRLLFLGIMFLPIYAFIIAPAAGYVSQFAVSRERELLADADAALLTRYPPGLARALAKISVPGNAVIDTQPSIAHLWIVDPREAKSGRWPGILSTHPPLAERLEALSRMGGTTPEMIRKAEDAGCEYRDAVGIGSR